MDVPDTYQTISAASTGEFKDRGSKFLSFAFPLNTLDEFQPCLEAVRKEHPKARHHCYAYRFGQDGNNYRANDDGEPSGTAGRPILGQIDSLGLTNILVVVARYFGGTLLGTSGLINAYKNSAANALANASVVEKKIEDVFQISFDYAVMGDLMDALKKAGAEIINQFFDEKPQLTVAVRQSKREKVITGLKAYIGKISLEEAESIGELPGLRIDYLYTR